MTVVIVYGALRSGSTLLRLMLDGHSQMSCDGEHDFIFDYVERDDGGWRMDLAGLRHDRILLAHGLTLPQTDNGVAAVADLVNQTVETGGADYTILMLHRGLDKALELLPNSPVIHLLRDPRDVARSWVGMGWQGNVYRAVEGWMAVEQSWDRAAPPIASRSVELRYEQLVTSPEQELTSICAFLGCDFDQGMFAYPQTTTYGAPDASFANQWRKKMPPKDQRLIEGRLGDYLAEKGYKPSGEGTREPSKAELLFLDAQSASGRWRHMIGQYGYLPIQRTLGRRLGLKSVQRSAQAKIDAIMNERYLK